MNLHIFDNSKRFRLYVVSHFLSLLVVLLIHSHIFNHTYEGGAPIQLKCASILYAILDFHMGAVISTLILYRSPYSLNYVQSLKRVISGLLSYNLRFLKIFLLDSKTNQYVL